MESIQYATSLGFFYQKTSTGNTSWEPPTKPLVFATRNRQPLSKSTLGGGVPDFEVSISQQKIIYQDLLCQEVNWISPNWIPSHKGLSHL